MIIKTLWMGNEVSRSLIYTDDMTDSGDVRIFADEGKGITDGIIVTEAIDRPKEDIDKWIDCELSLEFFEKEKTEESDYQGVSLE